MLLWAFYAIISLMIFTSIVCDDDLNNGEKFISKTAVMAVFNSTIHSPGACQYLPIISRKQNHQCHKDFGLVDAIKEARQLAVNHCEEQFRYDRWNCSVETRGKRNIFKKLYRETAFVHALTAAALTHSVAKACAEGRMKKCSCGTKRHGTSEQVQKRPSFKWAGCNDNIRHGKRITRIFLDLQHTKINEDHIGELLRHDSEVGIQAVAATMKDKCKCHGVSGSCSMKTCWRKLSGFNITASILRQKYHQAIRKPLIEISKRDAANLIHKKKKKVSPYSTLYYLETSPTFCSVTKGRQCLHPDNCATLCCGRGYDTRVTRLIEKCRCRFKDGRCCQVICDLCQRFEDRYYCK